MHYNNYYRSLGFILSMVAISICFLFTYFLKVLSKLIIFVLQISNLMTWSVRNILNTRQYFTFVFKAIYFIQNIKQSKI